jgi:hypothetical protein
LPGTPKDELDRVVEYVPAKKDWVAEPDGAHKSMASAPSPNTTWVSSSSFFMLSETASAISLDESLKEVIAKGEAPFHAADACCILTDASVPDVAPMALTTIAETSRTAPKITRYSVAP